MSRRFIVFGSSVGPKENWRGIACGDLQIRGVSAKAMVSAFGGSSNSLERRRRLMTLEEREVSDEILRDFGIIVSESVDEATAPGPIGERFLPRLISRHLWKHWAFLVPVFLLAAGLSHGLVSEGAELTGTQLIGRIASGCSGILFLLTAQLCLVVGWMRSQSTVDFRGSYRAWRWAAGISGLTAALSLTGIISVLPDLVALLLEPVTGRLAASRFTLVLVPGILLLAPILFRLIPDMGRCRTSQGLMTLGVVALIACVGIQINRSISVPPATSGILLLNGSVCVFAACMLHARYVMYVSHDPPVSRIRPAGTQAEPVGEVVGSKVVSNDKDQPDEQPESKSHNNRVETVPDSEPLTPMTQPAATQPEPALPQPAQAQPAPETGVSKQDKKKQKQKSLRKAG